MREHDPKFYFPLRTLQYMVIELGMGKSSKKKPLTKKEREEKKKKRKENRPK
jgi:hypothetical protein